MGPQAPKDPNLVAQGLPQTPTWSLRETQGPQLGGARPLKTMLGPTRGSKLAKIELSLLSCSWARFWAPPLGALLGALVTVLKHSGALLGRSGDFWGALGHSWATLGPLLMLSWLTLVAPG